VNTGLAFISADKDILTEKRIVLVIHRTGAVALIAQDVASHTTQTGVIRETVHAGCSAF